MSMRAADDPDTLPDAIARLDAGELVVVPTGAEYALACDALHEDAIDRVFLAKGRGADRALPVAVGAFDEAQHVAFPTTLARQLAESLWPGPVALVMRARPWLPDALLANGSTVAVRCPTHPFARELARHFGPLALTRLDAVDAEAAARLIGTHASLVIDGGAGTRAALTVIDATGDVANVLVEGHVGAAEIARHGPRRG